MKHIHVHKCKKESFPLLNARNRLLQVLVCIGIFIQKAIWQNKAGSRKGWAKWLSKNKPGIYSPENILIPTLSSGMKIHRYIEGWFCMENNTIINNTRTNCVLHTHNCQPTFPCPCISHFKGTQKEWKPQNFSNR